MPVGPELLPLTMTALIGGLVVFALLLLTGTVLVRWLALPLDLPEGPRFEPPPPPTITKGDRATAAVAAAAQTRLRTVYEEAHVVVRLAGECQGLHQQVVAAGAGEPFAAVALVTEPYSVSATEHSNALHKALTAFDQRLRTERSAVSGADIDALRTSIAEHAATVQELLRQTREALKPLPDGGNRRLILLVVMLVVMIAWVVTMRLMLNK